MTHDFDRFAWAVAQQFKRLAETTVFTTKIDGDDLYAAYLAAFPDGTNPILKTRPEHDCSTCKQFIRRAGNVIAIIGSEPRTVWDMAAQSAPHPYNDVAATLRARILAAEIDSLFVVEAKEAGFGAELSRSMGENGQVCTWHHLHTGEIPARLRAASAGQRRGDYQTTVQVFERGLIELKPEAVDTVLDMVNANALYRGEEHKPAIAQFRKAQQAYLKLDPNGRSLFVWTHAGEPAARFRNTVIGTLVQDLSEGVDVERAVAAFETKVAPQNYKRTSAIITPGMVKKAMETIAELGLEPALERRFARIEDISVRDVLWVDGSTRGKMKGGLESALMQQAAIAVSHDIDVARAEVIAIDDFIQKVLPQTTTMEVLFENAHLGNLMSITAPVHPAPKQLFRWTNDFAWSYGGNVTDSIKERVKKAGGRVEGVALRVSLSWFNYDDLDLHVTEPGGDHIYFGRPRSRHDGHLDVDMNVNPTTREAVENIVWPKPIPGWYEISVHNFNLRERIDLGFTVEVEHKSGCSTFSYKKGVSHKSTVTVVRIHVDASGQVVNMRPGDDISTAAAQRDRWGLRTGQFVKVNAVMLSPNYWGDNAVGNKHTFFVLDGARNDEPTRGVYNEFLHPRLEAHRKVFEIIGEKTKCQPTEGQLSGLGFSSTKQDAVIVRSGRRLYKVKIGA